MIVYATTGEIKAYAEEIGFDWAELDEVSKKKLAYRATEDIEILHGQPRQSPEVPYGLGNQYFRQAAIRQALHLVNVNDTRESREMARAYTMGKLDDRVKSVNSLDGDHIGPMVKDFVEMGMADLGHWMNNNTFERA